MRGAYRAFAILLVAVLAIVLIMNSTNTSTGRIVTEIAGDPECSSLTGYEGKIAIDAETKMFSSKYSTVSQQDSVDWLNGNIRDCKRAKEGFDSFCGNMMGDCRTLESSCSVVDARVGFNCETDLPQRCDYSVDGEFYVYSCSIDATEINLGTCTCESSD